MYFKETFFLLNRLIFINFLAEGTPFYKISRLNALIAAKCVPIHDGVEMAEYRGDVLWNLDKNDKVRFSHENSDVLTLYHEYFKEPLSSRSHHLLHTDLSGWKMPNEK